ncbi:MAG TPA: DUF6544 family protein [Acidimicrobiales bacterium]|nr:DUF6544 family protein [Acidimicrobiales bacterium]
MTTPAWRELELMIGSTRFNGAAPVDLPEPVARYFEAALGAQAHTASAAILTMRGSIKLGRWLPFRARQLLAPRLGTVWEATVAGLIRGSDRYVDGVGAMEWKLFGVVPIVRAAGTDVTRSTAERAAGESIWVPSAVSPAAGTKWRATSPRSITATIDTGGHRVPIEHLIDDEGRLISSSFLRWGDPDRTGIWTAHPFGVVVAEHRRFGSIQVPSRGEAGWYPGTDRWRDGVFFRFELEHYAIVPT